MPLWEYTGEQQQRPQSSSSLWPTVSEIHMDYILRLFLSQRVEIKFPKSPFGGMKLGHPQKFQRLDTDFLSTPMGLKLGLFSLYLQQFPRYRLVYTLPYFAMKRGHWQQLQTFHLTLFLLQRNELKCETWEQVYTIYQVDLTFSSTSRSS